MTLKDRLVMITGASAGIGEACAEAFAREGAAWSWPPAGATAWTGSRRRLAAAHGTKAHLLELDVRDRVAVNAAVGRAARPPGATSTSWSTTPA